MAIDPKKLLAFAGKKPEQKNQPPKKKGNPFGGSKPHDDNDHGEHDDHHDDDEPEGEGEHDEPAWADEMMGWLDDLEEEYPELGGLVEDMADAIEDGDKEGQKRALESLVEFMTTEMNDEYPQLSGQEKAQAGDHIAEHAGHGHAGGVKHAIGIGIRQASPGKFAKFEKARG